MTGRNRGSSTTKNTNKLPRNANRIDKRKPATNPLVHIKTEINGHELNIMLDPGSPHTVISDNLKIS